VRIEKLRIALSEGEVGEWLNRGRPKEFADLSLSFRRGALGLRGVFRPEGILAALARGDVAFETDWEPSVRADGRVVLRLARIEARGLPQAMLRGLVLEMISRRLPSDGPAEVDEDAIVLDAAGLLAQLPVRVETRLTSVAVEDGRVLVEAEA
jgi:hypothetical protein